MGLLDGSLAAQDGIAEACSFASKRTVIPKEGK